METESRSPVRCTRSVRALHLALALALLAGLAAFAPASARAEIVGNTYTSPNYGSTVSWDDSWFVIEEESREFFDILRITNGITFVSIFTEPNDYPSPELALVLMTGGWRSDPQLSNWQSILDAAGNPIRGGDPGRAFAGYSYTYTADDGSTTDIGTYFEARSIHNGELLMSIAAETRIENFQTEYQLAGITLPEAAVAEVPEFVAGEPAPVFADGGWRVGVATASYGTAFPSIGLAEKDDKDWLVAVVDVTNWTDRAQPLSVRDIRLSLAGVEKPVRVAPASTVAVGERLELTELTDELTVSIQPDETVRIALVYSVPAGSTEPHLILGKARIPMADMLELQFNADALPAFATAPETEIGTISSASDGRTMRIQIAGESDARRIRLLGVEPPAKGACLANGAENVLDNLVGRRVLVEEDASITGGEGAQRYVWLTGQDGTRTLLNQTLIADGLAQAAAIPDDARFALWLETSERAAEEAGIGLWAGCETPEADGTSARPDASPTTTAPSPSPTPRRSTPTPQPTDTSAERTDWHGEINLLGTIDFTMEDGALTAISVSYTAPCTEAGVTRRETFSTNSIDPVPLVAGSFEFEFPLAPTGNPSDGLSMITITGSLTSATTAVGTFTLPPIDGCTTEEVRQRWTASPE